MIRLIGVMLSAVVIAGCAAPPRPADPGIPSNEVRKDLFEAPRVRLHRFSYAGARVPDGAFEKAMATIERHLGREIEVIDHGEQREGWGVGGPEAPIRDRGRGVSAEDVAAAGGRYVLAEPDRGIVGVIDQRRISGLEEGPDRMLPWVEDGTIIVVEIPGSEDGSGATGFATVLAVGAEPAQRSGTVVLCRSAIKRRSNWFVSEAKLAQWTLTHEIGHVLGVPASNTHKWLVPGLGVHCTRPQCVMYTGLDWRVVVTGVLKGWPMEFCGLCRGELEAARVAAGSR